jgi:hypothetical protein
MAKNLLGDAKLSNLVVETVMDQRSEGTDRNGEPSPGARVVDVPLRCDFIIRGRIAA